MKKIFILLFLMSLIIRAPARAEMMTFIETYTYDAGEADSKLSCRAISLVEAKRLLLEKLGTYIQSRSTVKDFVVTKDEITTLSAGIVKTEILDEKWDGSTYVLTARIKADPDDVARRIKELLSDKSKSEEIRKIEVVSAQSIDKINELKAQLETVQKNLVAVTGDYEKSAKIVGSWDAFEKGVEHAIAGEFQEAAEAFTRAIELNPSYIAYFNRGNAYMQLKEYKSAIDDFKTVLKIKPNHHNAYFKLGMCLVKIKKRNKGISYIVKAARMGSGSAKRWLKVKGQHRLIRKDEF